MPPNNSITVDGNFWILIWSDAMIETFLELLEKTHNNEKRSDIKFKPKVRVGFWAGV